MNVAYAETSVAQFTDAVIPQDNTIPQIGEGGAVLSANINVQFATSRLKIKVDGVATALNGGIITCALFVAGAASAVATWGVNAIAAGSFMSISSGHLTGVIGVTGNVTVELRAGLNDNSGGNKIVFGSRDGQTSWGGASAVRMTVMEIVDDDEILSWNGSQISGTIPVTVPGIAHYLVAEPNGNNPTEADLLSHRYRHHTLVVEHHGKVWVAHSSGGKNEDSQGMMTVAEWSPVDNVSFSSPIAIVKATAPFDVDAAAGTGHVAMPRDFRKLNDKLYLICAIDYPTQVANVRTGIALVARELYDNGGVGPCFRVSPVVYVSQNGLVWPSYDPVISPQLYAQSKIYGIWGGSSPTMPASEWIGWVKQGIRTFTEPTTFMRGAGRYIRLWRHVANDDGSALSDRLWISYSGNGTAWSRLWKTNIPNVAVSSGIALSDGRIAIVGNLVGENRDPLYLAIFNPATGFVTSMRAVRQGLSNDPVYPGQYKHGAEAYPCLYEGENYVWVSYSNAKERIYVSRIPKANI